MIRPPPKSPLFPYAPLFRSAGPPPHLQSRRPAPRLKRSRSVAETVTERLRTRTSDRVAEGEHPFRVDGPLDRQQPLACRSEEHTSELQSRQYLVCRLLLEKK